ncbi:glycosyltransferase family A protein [Hamadaea tsunoensis]|uniref:glycosyltransferase family A protein n=1 Tax=Hamadaea tsunoensis TaxID=53368 RepID=UPI000418FEC9|nr:glycosyltransferase family A protein [Hamadaea tsunoensis]
MRELPLVSVIVPNYNYASTLGACIESAQRQTYPSVEVIVADDASTDDSVAVARARGVTVLETDVNAGVSTARNRGAAAAAGDILFFVDSDVALEPDAIAQAVTMLRDKPEVGAVCGMYLAEPMFPDTLVKRYRAIQQFVWFTEIDGPIPGLHSALFAIRRATFEEIGPFNTNLRWTEEQDYGFRLNARYQVLAASAIRGRHDHDGTLRVMITKVFQRTRLGAPNWLRLGSMPGGAGTPYRALGSGFVLLALLGLLVSPFLGAWGLGGWGFAATALALIIGIALDGRTYAYAFRHHGVLFGLQFTVLHLLVMLTSAVAGGLGILSGLLFPSKTRRLYGVRNA